MTDFPPYKRFEQQIERIHQLLEPDGTKVVWNDHIPDPDNPDQQRQIDIAIRKDGFLTIVECRLRKGPQDVTWIEELMGRRISLNADSVTAVSASGFTSTAKEKATRYGIILRDLETVSDEEVIGWGKKRKIALNYCEFSHVQCVAKVHISPVPARPMITDPSGKTISPIAWRLLFQEVMFALDKQKWSGKRASFDLTVQRLLLVNGVEPDSIKFTGKARRIKEDISLVSVAVYADPVTSKSHAEVGHFGLGSSEIIDAHDHISVVVDLSAVKTPKSCCFETALVDVGRVVRTKPSFIGYEHLIRCDVPVGIKVEFLKV